MHEHEFAGVHLECTASGAVRTEASPPRTARPLITVRMLVAIRASRPGGCAVFHPQRAMASAMFGAAGHGVCPEPYQQEGVGDAECSHTARQSALGEKLQPARRAFEPVPDALHDRHPTPRTIAA